MDDWDRIAWIIKAYANGEAGAKDVKHLLDIIERRLLKDHLEVEDCWCHPKVTEHPGGNLIVHTGAMD